MASNIKEKRTLKKNNIINFYSKRRLAESAQLYLLLLPAAIYLLLFHYQPMYGIQIAFRDYTAVGGITGSEWVSFYHFERFFTSARFWTLIKNTMSINLLEILAFPAPIILALLLNYCVSLRYKKAVQMITYAPHFISVVVMVGMITLFLSPSTGFINHFLVVLGFRPVSFLMIPRLFKYIYVLSGVWQNIGWGSILYIGALTAISPELHEAAIMDGANKIKRILYVDIPGIKGTVIIMFIMRIGHIMNLGFQKVFLMQNGANLPASEVISTYVYQVGLVQSNYSYSTAIGLFNTVINIILLISANRIARVLSGTSLF